MDGSNGLIITKNSYNNAKCEIKGSYYKIDLRLFYHQQLAYMREQWCSILSRNFLYEIDDNHDMRICEFNKYIYKLYNSFAENSYFALNNHNGSSCLSVFCNKKMSVKFIYQQETSLPHEDIHKIL